MTEDKLFIGILDAVNNMDFSDNLKGDELMRKFSVMYKEGTDNKEFKKNPMIEKVVKNYIPEYYL